MVLGGIDAAIALRFAMVLAVAIGAWFFADWAGDIREARVRQEYNEAILKTNAEIDVQLSADEKLALVMQRARETALAEAKAVPAVGPVCPATELQATSLSKIK